MKVNIILASLQDSKYWSYNKLCIDSIKRTSKINHNITLVTNGSPEIPLPEGFEGIKRLHHESQGQCMAFNMGVDVAETEYVMIIDNDFVFSENWEVILDKLEGKELLCGNLVEPGIRGSSFITHNSGETPETFDQEDFEKFVLERKRDEIAQGFGFPILVKKELWQKIGGYDPVWDPFGSNCDSDFTYKIMLAGVPLQQYHGSLFFHFQGVSGTFTNPEADQYWTRNLNHFPRKWGFGRVGQPKIWSGEFIIPLDKLIFRPNWAKLENNPFIQIDETFNESIECPSCRYEYLKFRNNHCPKCNT